MTAISWKKGINGDWTTASDWGTDTVPGPADDASLSASVTYTVTSDASVTVNSLTTAKGAILEIAAGNFNGLAVRELASTPGKLRWPTAQASRSAARSTTPERSRSIRPGTRIGQVTLTGTGRAGFYVIEKALNHTVSGVRGIYNRAEYSSRARQGQRHVPLASHCRGARAFSIRRA